MKIAKQIIEELSATHAMTLSAIADECGSTLATISRIRSGAVSQCQSDLYIQLSLALKRRRRNKRQSA